MEFRKQALSTLQSPEELDLPVRLARPQGPLVLAVTLVVMAVGCFWAVAGTVDSTVNGAGVLTYAQGSYVLQSPVAGQVTDVLAEAGQRLSADAPLLKVRTRQGDRTVRAIAAGRVTTLAVTIGAVVTTGADVATVERTDDTKAPLMAIVYVHQDSAATVPVGAAVDLAIAAAPAQRYGTLRGHVRSVGTAAQTRQQITAFLGDDQLGEAFTEHGRPVPVLVRLDRSSTTKSGYRWSSAEGPPYRLDSMTQAAAAVRLPGSHPIDWLLP